MSNNGSVKKKYCKYREEPIKEDLVVFESLWGRAYSCNPAALYEYINENHPEYECVWFLNDTETPVPGRARKVEHRSDEYWHCLATAKYLIYNANFPESFVKRDGQILVQTMHGTPFKTFGLDVKEELPTDKEKIRVVKRSMIWDYLVAQGEFTKNMAWRWFRYDNKVLETGYPRTDSLFVHDDEETGRIRKEMGLPKGKKIILYAPTWRDMDHFDMMLDLEQLRLELSDEYIILVRPHYFVADKYAVPVDGSFVFDGGRAGRIEELFQLTDILITDYSSVMFDFALTGKPMIFYTYDLDEYTKETRGGYFDITNEAPGPLAATTAEVADIIKDLDMYCEINSERIEKFRNKYLTYENADSTARVYDAVFVRDERIRKNVMRSRMMAVLSRVLPRRIYKRIKNKMILRRINDGRS